MTIIGTLDCDRIARSVSNPSDWPPCGSRITRSGSWPPRREGHACSVGADATRNPCRPRWSTNAPAFVRSLLMIRIRTDLPRHYARILSKQLRSDPSGHRGLIMGLHARSHHRGGAVLPGFCIPSRRCGTEPRFGRPSGRAGAAQRPGRTGPRGWRRPPDARSPGTSRGILGRSDGQAARAWASFSNWIAREKARAPCGRRRARPACRECLEAPRPGASDWSTSAWALPSSSAATHRRDVDPGRRRMPSITSRSPRSSPRTKWAAKKIFEPGKDAGTWRRTHSAAASAMRVLGRRSGQTSSRPRRPRLRLDMRDHRAAALAGGAALERNLRMGLQRDVDHVEAVFLEDRVALLADMR